MAKDVRSHAEELEEIGECDFWSKVKTRLILSLVEGKSVLDVGCGPCRLAKVLLDNGHDMTVIDSDPKAIEIAENKGIVGFVADISSWETVARFDCVVAADMLEHIDDDRLAIKRIHDVLKPGGCFVVNVPAYKFLFGQHDISLGHKRRYSDRELRAKLEEAGFKIEVQRHWNLLALPITILLTRILKRDYPHEQVSRLTPLSTILEKLLILESKVNPLFGISILCKAKKV
jgi:2-polyprenyl-3-methyl-5-hydroxy-6-metoxy-1,4-benzoquinol methylase